jgi:hypothetical protein
MTVAMETGKYWRYENYFLCNGKGEGKKFEWKVLAGSHTNLLIMCSVLNV